MAPLKFLASLCWPNKNVKSRETKILGVAWCTSARRLPIFLVVRFRTSNSCRRAIRGVFEPILIHIETEIGHVWSDSKRPMLPPLFCGKLDCWIPFRQPNSVSKSSWIVCFPRHPSIVHPDTFLPNFSPRWPPAMIGMVRWIKGWERWRFV